MRLVVDLPAEDFEAVERGDMQTLVGPVTAVELRQDGGLLAFERRAAFVAFVSRAAAPEGAAEGGPLIRVDLARKED